MRLSVRAQNGIIIGALLFAAATALVLIVWGAR